MQYLPESGVRGLTEDYLIHDGVNGVSSPMEAEPAHPAVMIVLALDTITHVAHFFTNYFDVPGISYVDETPSTLLFTSVNMKQNKGPGTDERNAMHKWIRRIRMAPAKLFVFIWR